MGFIQDHFAITAGPKYSIPYSYIEYPWLKKTLSTGLKQCLTLIRRRPSLVSDVVFFQSCFSYHSKISVSPRYIETRWVGI